MTTNFATSLLFAYNLHLAYVTSAIMKVLITSRDVQYWISSSHSDQNVERQRISQPDILLIYVLVNRTCHIGSDIKHLKRAV